MDLTGKWGWGVILARSGRRLRRHGLQREGNGQQEGREGSNSSSMSSLGCDLASGEKGIMSSSCMEV
jgi:hypothetical protein